MRAYSLLHLIFLFLPVMTLQAETSLPVERECKRISGKLASVSYRECLDQQFTASDGLSVRQAPLLQREYLGVTQDLLKGRVLLVGGIHGDEYASVTIVFKWLALLNEGNAGRYHWLVVPLLNPDGLLQPYSERVNTNGRDLQAAFPANQSSSNMTPETEWLAGMIRTFRPDVIVALHAPHELVDYPALESGDYFLQKINVDAGGNNAGSMNRYTRELGIPLLTVELPYADIMPSAGEVKMIWQDVLRWIDARAGDN